MDPRRLGIIESDVPDMELPDCNAWTYLHPFFKKWPHLTALVCGQTFRSYTYLEVFEASLRWAKELKNHFEGEDPPVVSIICPNSAEYPILYLGCLAVGVPLCPIRHDYGEDVILNMLKETKTSIAVVDLPVLETCRKIFAKLDRSVKVYVSGSGQLKPDEINAFNILFSDAEMLDVEAAKQVNPECTAVITYSSGTTGMPKGILVPQKGHIFNAISVSHPSIFALRAAEGSFQDTILLTLPLSHTYGLEYTAMIAVSTGSRVIICDPLDMSNILNIMEKYKPRILKLNPYVLDHLTRLTDFGTAFEKVEIVINVGSSHNPVSFKELNEKTTKKLMLQECYGSSEMGVALCSPMNQLDILGVTGKPIPNTKVRLKDIITGEPILEPHKHGELYFQIPSLMKGYLNRPEATKEVVDEGNWFRTGDVGYFDDQHFLVVIERFKDIINVKGKQVFPASIEKILKQHDSVVDAGVIGTPNMTTEEEEPKAFVIRKGEVEESEIINFVKEKAPPEMWLQGGVQFVDSLPRNSLGKMIRKNLRTMAWLDSHAKVK